MPTAPGAVAVPQPAINTAIATRQETSTRKSPAHRRSLVSEDLPPYSLALQGITQAAYTSAGRKRRAHHAKRPSRAVSRLPKVTKARSETPKSAKESQSSSAPTGTNSALVTI